MQQISRRNQNYKCKAGVIEINISICNIYIYKNLFKYLIFIFINKALSFRMIKVSFLWVYRSFCLYMSKIASIWKGEGNEEN